MGEIFQGQIIPSLLN